MELCKNEVTIPYFTGSFSTFLNPVKMISYQGNS
jgi:hypothetical protein